MSLNLYQRPKDGTAPELPLDGLADGWIRSSTDIGGYDSGTFTITGKPVADLMDYYNTWLGKVVVERQMGMVAWEGYIAELRLTLNGVEYFQSLDTEWFSNYVTAYYSSDIGERDVTTTYQNTNSQEQFGRMERGIFMGGATADAAAALAQQTLAEYGWPRSRLAGSVRLGGGTTGLQCVCRGFWHTLNWRNKGATSTQAANLHVSDAVTASEFITSSRVDANTLSVKVDCHPNPRPWADVLSEVTEQGDGSYNRWRCGVYENRTLVYEAVEERMDYRLVGGRLVDISGNAVTLPLVKPGFYVQLVDAPVGWLPMGGAAVDSAYSAYVNRVVYDSVRDSLSLSTSGISEGLLNLQAQIAQGTE